MPAMRGLSLPQIHLLVQQRRRFFYPSGTAFSALPHLVATILSRPCAALVLSSPTSRLLFSLVLFHVPRLAVLLSALSPAHAAVQFVVPCHSVRHFNLSPLSLPSVAVALPRFSSLHNRTNAPSGCLGSFRH